MAAIKPPYPKSDISEDTSTSVVPSTKVAEIHRESSGQIFYICFHCGLSLDNIADTLSQISFHFNPPQNIKADVDENEDPLDFFVIKHEDVDDESQEMVKNSQLEHVFIDQLQAMDDKRDVRKSIDMGRQTLLAKEKVSTVRMRLIKEEGPKIQKLKDQRLGTEKLLCTLCPQLLTSTVNFMQHTFMHYDLKPFACPECPAKFCRKGTLDEHLSKRHSMKVTFNFQCRFCNDDKAGNIPEFVTHTFNYHLDDGEIDTSDLNSKFTYDCRFCFKNFTQWKELHQHIAIHKDDELLPYPTAGNRCMSEKAKSGSYRSESLYNCSRCTKTLCGSFEARNHWTAEHRSEDELDELRKIVNKNVESVVRIVQSFKCFDCDEISKSRLCFMKHRLKHFNIRPYPCTECSKTFHLHSAAIRHQKLSHNIISDPRSVNRQCHFCKANFTEEIDFITHMFDKHLYETFDEDKHLDDKCQYECVYCKVMVTKEDLMIQHLKIHDNEVTPKTETDLISPEATINALRHKVEYMYCCLDCPQKFRLPYMASEHRKLKHKTEHEEKRKKSRESTTCDVCNTTFHTWRSMVVHRGKQHPETNNPEGWNNKKKYNTQPKQTLPPKNTNCPICNKSFPTWRSMLNHKANRHPETRKTDLYKHRPVCYCQTCGKAFRDRGNLNKHEKAHLDPRPFTCDICKKQFTSKVTLQTHMLIHTKQKNFVCEKCGKSFISVSKLNFHNQVHKNLTFKCSLCDKVFLTRNNFSKHKRTHENRTRKECKECDKTFKSALSLRIHTLLHTGEKKYSCRYCSMTFAQSSGRRGHERTKHEKVD